MAQASSSRRHPYPSPIAIPPSSGQHQYSLIILHGRGSNAATFAPTLISTPIPLNPTTTTTISEALPTTKLIFPTASRRRATIYNRSMITQWFDSWHLSAIDKHEELQFIGLRESTVYLHSIIRDEIAELGGVKGRVGIWGLSQGCATCLVAGLLWEEIGHQRGLGAVVGMCGWLPLRGRIDVAVEDDGNGKDGDEDGLFERQEGEEEGRRSKLEKCVDYLREELDLPKREKKEVASAKVPIFLGHGIEDEKVAIGLSREANELLRKLDLDVAYEEYAGLGHWYSREMLRDVVLFLKARAGWQVKGGNA